MAHLILPSRLLFFKSLSNDKGLWNSKESWFPNQIYIKINKKRAKTEKETEHKGAKINKLAWNSGLTMVSSATFPVPCDFIIWIPFENLLLGVLYFHSKCSRTITLKDILVHLSDTICCDTRLVFNAVSLPYQKGSTTCLLEKLKNWRTS